MYATILVLSCALVLTLFSTVTSFSTGINAVKTVVISSILRRDVLQMNVRNDDFAKSQRFTRKAGADDRSVELRKPMGIDLDEDDEGDVFVVGMDPKGRAAKSGMVFIGDRVNMVSATFGDDMWSCRGVGLTRVLSCIKVRNTKPVQLILEAPDAKEEKKRRDIAFREPTEAEKIQNAKKEEELMEEMLAEDKQLLNKRKGLFGLW